MKNYPTVKVAAVQAAPVFMNLEATVDKTCKLIAEAASMGAKVIGFPEAFIPGYPYWIWTSNMDFTGMMWAVLFKNAIEIPSKEVQQISDAAKKNGVYVCVSVSEKDNASLYLTQLWFDPNGNLIGKHRKFKPTSSERAVWGDGDGSMAPVFKTEYGNLGGLQCWEHALPLNIAAMGSLNEQVHVASWPAFVPKGAVSSRVSSSVCASTNAMHQIISQFYAISNQVYVIMSTNLVGQDMIDMIGKDEFSKNFLPLGSGNTAIISNTGEILASIPQDAEGIAVAEIDLNQIIYGKWLLDPAGHYSTPGFLSLTFDQSEHVPVKKIGEQTNHFISYEDLHEDKMDMLTIPPRRVATA
uniref:Aliphatic nitrilase n=1 Tax=Comamonas testosteroni TaxID=285 RepID=Q59329_COMTE|nr:aliphatic nitrilase [Comamonas testosteroni]